MIELLLQAERAMSVGLVDRAEVLYRQVAEADPQNSIAVVGLARVALERGDEAGALALAQRALTIDPENAAAARMVERLDEVIAYRGEAPAATEEPADDSGSGAGQVNDLAAMLPEKAGDLTFERAGYDAESAAVLAASPEVDLHRAVSLVKGGCPVALALQILL